MEGSETAQKALFVRLKESLLTRPQGVKSKLRTVACKDCAHSVNTIKDLLVAGAVLLVLIELGVPHHEPDIVEDTQIAIVSEFRPGPGRRA